MYTLTAGNAVRTATFKTMPARGQRVRLVIRNGFTLEEPLLAVGPYDLVLGSEGAEVLVPLHALLSWEPISEEAAPSA